MLKLSRALVSSQAGSRGSNCLLSGQVHQEGRNSMHVRSIWPLHPFHRPFWEQSGTIRPFSKQSGTRVISTQTLLHQFNKHIYYAEHLPIVHLPHTITPSHITVTCYYTTLCVLTSLCCKWYINSTIKHSTTTYTTFSRQEPPEDTNCAFFKMLAFSLKQILLHHVAGTVLQFWNH